MRSHGESVPLTPRVLVMSAQIPVYLKFRSDWCLCRKQEKSGETGPMVKQQLCMRGAAGLALSGLGLGQPFHHQIVSFQLHGCVTIIFHGLVYISFKNIIYGTGWMKAGQQSLRMWFWRSELPIYSKTKKWYLTASLQEDISYKMHNLL